MTEKRIVERRQQPRAKVHATAIISRGTFAGEFTVKNLSAGGALVRGIDPGELGATDFILLLEGQTAIPIQATILRKESSKTTCSVALEFHNVPFHHQECIQEAVLQALSRDRQRASVLFVDDDLEVLDAFEALLEDEPFDVYTAASEREALAWLETKDIDLIIADEEMPGTLGHELLQLVRDSHPDVGRLLLSGHTPSRAVVNALHNGAVHHLLVKPVAPESIRRALEQTLLEVTTADVGKITIAPPGAPTVNPAIPTLLKHESQHPPKN